LKRLVIGDIELTPEADAFVTLSMTHFKARVGVLPVFADAELKRVTMPVLLIGGARDALRDIDRIAARLKALLPQLTALILPDAGHVVLNTTETIIPFLTAADRNT
jgi:pimeloyl-ACP methyl ester carboxylesterase